MNLEEERDSLRRELRGVQEMLYQVLYSVGEPVVVSCETLRNGMTENKRIDVFQDIDNDVFIFSLKEIDE